MKKEFKESYIIDYGTKAEREQVFGTLNETKAIADKHAHYTGKSINIYNAEHQLISTRNWYKCYNGIFNCLNPISFSRKGFYDDWYDW